MLAGLVIPFELIRHDVTEPIKLEARIWHLAVLPTTTISSIQLKLLEVSWYLQHVAGRRVGARLLPPAPVSLWRSGVRPQPENCWPVNPIGIRSCYDEGKRIAGRLF